MVGSMGKDTYSIASKVDVWDMELQGDIDRDFLLEGLNHGFRISSIDERSNVKSVSVNNHPSVYKYRDIVEKELRSQIDCGYYVVTDCKPTVISPLGAILKEDGVNVRLIHDGSRPFGEAMNDYCEPHSVKYQSLQEALELAKPGTFLAKVDLKSAYRSVPISEMDYCLTGIEWTFEGDVKPTWLFDTRLPFGSRLGPMTFHRCSQAVRRFMANRGYHNLIVYLDDFLIVADSYQECLDAQHVLISLLIDLGFLVSWGKVLGPTQCLPFLGIVINTEYCTLSLDREKLCNLQNKLREFHGRKRASKRQLQSLAGALNWACQAIRGGRFFLRRILDCICKLKQGTHKCKLTGEFYKDVRWWLSFLHRFNGVVYYHKCDQINVHTDACNTGAGMFCMGDWHYINWCKDIPAVNKLHINYKEVMAIVLSAIQFADRWCNLDVVVVTDSTVAKAIINKGTCKNKYVMQALRKLFWLSVQYNFRIRAIHFPGSINEFPDCISRLHEPGQVLRLQALLSNWFHTATGHKIEWHCHMSPNAFQVIKNQLQKWSSILS